MLLIGLGHKARQGKNIFCQAMVEMRPEAKVYAFGDELKRYCAAHHDELFEKYPHVPKTQKSDPIYGYTRMLQYYGTEIARTEDPDVWVKAVDARLQEEQPKIAIITDLRFQNEVEYIQKKNGVLIDIVRLKDGKQLLSTDRDPNHESETGLDSFEGWDFVITTQDGELDALRESARIVLEEIINVLGEDGTLGNVDHELVLPGVSE